MLKRFQTSSLNLLVLGTSAAIFIISFLVLQGMANAQIPETITVLSAARSLQIGDQLQPNDIQQKTIFVDTFSPLYVTAEEAAAITGAYTAIPITAGQPILKAHLVSSETASSRFSAILSQFPDHSLFPLPLEDANVIAPPISIYKPGDMIGLTVVFRSRPQVPVTPIPTEDSFAFTLPGPAPTDLPPILPQPTTTMDEAAARGFPPLAKDLFPGGVRVIGIHGLPESSNASETHQGFNSFHNEKILILLIPDQSREQLSLALQHGDSIFISLLDHNAESTPSTGFTYWDFEEWFQKDREAANDTQR